MPFSKGVKKNGQKGVLYKNGWKRKIQRIY